jgi:hypothetical protein
MKTKLTLLTLAGLATAAHSQTVIDITGSTAGRSAVHAQITSQLDAGFTYAYDGTGAASRATRAIYQGTYNGNQYTIRTYWAGSVNGVRDVAQQIQQTEFFDKSVTGTAAGENVNPAAPKAPASAETAPEIGYSDVFQTSTQFTSPPLTVEDEVGIIAFQWFANKGSSAGLTNMTPGLVQALYGSLGELPLSLFTGVTADADKIVFAGGRNNDSGTRITTFAESGYGVFNQVNQSNATFDAPGGTISALTFVGDGGQSSGGTLADSLSCSLADGDFVGYVGASDWPRANDGADRGARELTWNGVPYSVENIQEGKYSFWGYLHMNRMALSGPALSFYEGMRDGLKANPGTLIKDDASVKVARDGDGAPIFPK